jgi:FkbM family methyltransferase
MIEPTLWKTFAGWLSKRRMRRFLSDKKDWKTVVRFRGCHFFAGGGGKIETALMRGERYYDRDNFSAISCFIKPGYVCFDVGANIGVYSTVLARIAGDAGLVHCFEPVDHVRARLRANARLNGMESMNINPFALGSQPGVREMHQIKEGRFRGGASTFVETENIAAIGESEFETREVEIKTLDQYVIDTGVNRVDFLKIDVEGFELEVLTGAADTLSKHRPTIILEYDEGRHGGQSGSLEGLLRGHGYLTYQFTLFGDTLVLLPFDFKRQPINRNVLCWNPDFER